MILIQLCMTLNMVTGTCQVYAESIWYLLICILEDYLKKIGNNYVGTRDVRGDFFLENNSFQSEKKRIPQSLFCLLFLSHLSYSCTDKALRVSCHGRHQIFSVRDIIRSLGLGPGGFSAHPGHTRMNRTHKIPINFNHSMMSVPRGAHVNKRWKSTRLIYMRSVLLRFPWVPVRANWVRSQHKKEKDFSQVDIKVIFYVLTFVVKHVTLVCSR